MIACDSRFLSLPPPFILGYAPWLKLDKEDYTRIDYTAIGAYHVTLCTADGSSRFAVWPEINFNEMSNVSVSSLDCCLLPFCLIFLSLFIATDETRNH